MNPQVEKILKLPAKIKIAIVAVIVVLEVVGFYFLMYAPKLDELSDLQTKLEKKQGEVKQKRVIASGLQQFRAQYEKAQIELKAALEKLPEKSEIPSLLTSVSTLAKDQGMTIALFKPKGESKREFYAQVNVDLKVQGTYHETAMFFDSVGKIKRIVNVGDFSMKKAKSSKTSSTIVNVDCVIQTYRFLDASEIAAKQNQKKGKRR